MTTTTVNLEEEGWTLDDLNSLTVQELRHLAYTMDIELPGWATKAEMVARLLNGGELPDPTPEMLISYMHRLRSWTKGVPPASDALLNAEQKAWLSYQWRMTLPGYDC